MEKQKVAVLAATGLEMRICLRTFRHFFNPGTDWFGRTLKRKDFDDSKAKERFDNWRTQQLSSIEIETLQEPRESLAPIAAVKSATPTTTTEATKPIEETEKEKEDVVMSTA